MKELEIYLKGMTMKTAIELAKEAGILFQCHTGILGRVNTSTEGSQSLERIERLVELARAEEREAFEALEKDAHEIFNNPPGETSQDVRDVIEWYAAAIRARTTP